MKVLKREIVVPYSKSYLNRLLILASISKGNKIIRNYSPCSDVDTLILCLKEIGVNIKIENDSIFIQNSFPECEIQNGNMITLNTKDGGTTLRFLLTLLTLGKKKYKLQFSKRMEERPLEELVEVLRKQKVQINFQDGIEIQGPIDIPPELIVDCRRSSQFASSLFLSLHQFTKIIPLYLDSSKTYFELTQQLISESKNDQFIAKADWSSASYPLALALFQGEVLIKNLFEKDPFQGDSVILDLLLQLGATATFSKNGLSFKGVDGCDGFEFDAKNCLDLVPTICFIASYAKTPSRIYNLKNLLYKESNRLAEILNLLKTFSVEFTYNEIKDELLIKGDAPEVDFKILNVPDDHRMVMTGYLFLKKNNGGDLNNKSSVLKSFPRFFEMME